VQRACAGFLIACLALPLSAAVARADDQSTNAPAVAASPAAKTDSFIQPKTLAELLALPPDQLEKVDIARIDLLCAEGLPGADDLDIEKCTQTLDAWAQYVKTETAKNYHRFIEHPEKFKNSSGRYQMAVMAAVLCQDLRVHYDPKREKELLDNNFFSQGEPYGKAERSFFSDSSDMFLHGLLSDKRYGTCASMPYLYVAIGRRLGYPVSIAKTHMHNYVYYDEGDGKHFNVEATEHRVFTTPTDDAYRHPIWGAPSSAEYFEKRGLLRPLSNKEALAHLLATRAAVFRSGGRHDEEAKTWAAAARYFPDTPTWKEIAQNMQQSANLDDYQKWRNGIWKELAGYYIPHGPGFAYFHDKRIKLHLFMNESFDRKAVAQVANEYKKELSDYTGKVMPLPDSGKTALNIAITNQPPPETPQVSFFYRPPDGNEVRVPADFMPPLPHGDVPMELKALISNLKPQDPDTLLEIMWQYYEHTQAMDLARQKAEIERIATGNPILISEESIPPEFRQGVPPDLSIQLSGLHSAQEIVIAMWQYKQQQALRQQQGMLTDPMGQVAAMLRQSGIPDSVARMSGLPVAGPQGPADPLTSALRQSGVPDSVARMAGLTGVGSQRAGLPGGVSGLNPFDGSPAMQGAAAQSLIPGGNPLTGKGGPWAERTKQANDQAMEILTRQIRPSDGMKPGFALPYQVVPASVAANNPMVQNPLPFGGSLGSLSSPNSPLTPLPQRDITTSTNKSEVP